MRQVSRIRETLNKDLWDGLSAPMRQVSRIRETHRKDLQEGLSAPMRQVSRIREMLRKELLDGYSAQWDRSAASVWRFLKIYEKAYQHYETGQ